SVSDSAFFRISRTTGFSVMFLHTSHVFETAAVMSSEVRRHNPASVIHWQYSRFVPSDGHNIPWQTRAMRSRPESARGPSDITQAHRARTPPGRSAARA